MTNLLGIHHVTAIAGDAQKNLDFYAGALGLRLVKKTINFDDPYTYHLYYGDDIGRPGTLLTFFPWTSQGQPGRKGSGQIGVYSFSVPARSLSNWKKKFELRGVEILRQEERFGEKVLSAVDPDGFDFELIGSVDVQESDTIVGLHSVTLSETDIGKTGGFFKNLGFQQKGESGGRHRFELAGGGPGKTIDLLHEPGRARGTIGVGTVHHVAWRTPDEGTQLQARTELVKAGCHVTPVMDRKYFRSIYFYEPGGVLLEVATDPPGFLIDETAEGLGMELKLPDMYESEREQIARHLPPIQIPTPSTRVMSRP